MCRTLSFNTQGHHLVHFHLFCLRVFGLGVTPVTVRKRFFDTFEKWKYKSQIKTEHLLLLQLSRWTTKKKYYKYFSVAFWLPSSHGKCGQSSKNCFGVADDKKCLETFLMLPGFLVDRKVVAEVVIEGKCGTRDWRTFRFQFHSWECSNIFSLLFAI